MKRFHVHVAVKDLGESVKFYSELLGMKPAVERPDYAKWMLVDPQVNFAISSRGHQAGVNHLGFQADDAEELAELTERASRASGTAPLNENQAQCCYAKSDKHWVLDPQGLAWEHFHTAEDAAIFGDDSAITKAHSKEPCCIPLFQQKRGEEDEPSTGACCISRAQVGECC